MKGNDMQPTHPKAKSTNERRARSALGNILKPALAALAVALVSLFSSGSEASPTNGYAEWSWGGLVARTYMQAWDGSVRLSFNRGGGLHTDWTNSSGTNVCPNQPELRLHANHPQFDELSKTLFAAALAKKQVHVWYEGVSGICWIKGVKVSL